MINTLYAQQTDFHGEISLNFTGSVDFTWVSLQCGEISPISPQKKNSSAPVFYVISTNAWRDLAPVCLVFFNFLFFPLRVILLLTLLGCPGSLCWCILQEWQVNQLRRNLCYHDLLVRRLIT